MQQKINVIFTTRVLELNGSLGFNDSLSSCNRAQVKVQGHNPARAKDSPKLAFCSQKTITSNYLSKIKIPLLCVFYNLFKFLYDIA